MVHADKDDTPEAAVARLRKLIQEAAPERAAVPERHEPKAKRTRMWWLLVLAVIAVAVLVFLLYQFDLLRIG